MARQQELRQRPVAHNLPALECDRFFAMEALNGAVKPERLNDTPEPCKHVRNDVKERYLDFQRRSLVGKQVGDQAGALMRRGVCMLACCCMRLVDQEL